MASLPLTVPDQHLNRVRHALCKDAGLEETTPNTRKAVMDWVKSTVARVEYEEAQEEALDSVTPPNVADVVS